MHLSKGEKKMAVLSKPVNMSFEVAEEKTTAFFAISKNGAFKKAIARSDKHIRKSEKENSNTDENKR